MSRSPHDQLESKFSAKRPISARGDRPGIVLGRHPERQDRAPAALDRALRAAIGIARVARRVGPRTLSRFARSVDAAGSDLEACSDAAFDEAVFELRRALYRRGLQDALLRRGFALTREASRRSLGLSHYDVQLYGGWVMLHEGLAELETGEGKTLTATLPASVAALAGIPVHVITANDYLVARDAEAMAPVFERLGLTVSRVIEEEPERVDRRRAYACDITYVTGKQVAFDYLRDRLEGAGDRGLSAELLAGHGRDEEGPVLRGLCFGLVDEADSVLIDDAGTPLILSRPGSPVDEALVHDALALARSLEEHRDYQVHARRAEVELNDHGRKRLAELAKNRKGALASERRRIEWVQRALAADHLYERDRHYLVRDDAIHIIDLPTGRRAPDRSFEGDVHALIEAKEGIALSPQRETIARISYQRFFQRYLRLGGMTGTAREVARELWSIYGLRMVTVPTRLPSRRRAIGRSLVPSDEARWQAAVERVAELHRAGCAVLVGTSDVAASERLSARLRRAGLPHQVLSASQDAEEAAIVMRAGEAGRITVATRMAGRGTDIALGPGVEDAGGLAVISTELADARRIDRQLFGRSGRQGAPGSYEQIVSLEDPLLVMHLPALAHSLLRRGLARPPLGNWLTRVAQMVEERRTALMRLRLMEAERAFADLMAFSSRRE
ncbi:MAG: prepilin peptidase [Deltaproteobacteria bacterium]|nr:prepilin peptidase [Deltaproteobacteria bacterium]